MSREVWFTEDLRNLLIASHRSLLLAGVDGDYRRGFEAALVTLALALGLEVSAGPASHPRPAAPLVEGWLTFEPDSQSSQ